MAEEQRSKTTRTTNGNLAGREIGLHRGAVVEKKHNVG